MQPNYPKLILAVILSAYVLWIAYDPMQGSFLDNVDLPIHETGHLIFRIFGEFIGIAGGSIFQVLVPLIFAAYFVWQRSFYSAAIVGLWIGQSLLNVWVYASDAQVMQLMLTSGMTGSEGGFHDWNYMLDSYGMLSSTPTIAKIIRFIATLTVIASAAAAVYLSFVPAEEEYEF